MMLLYGQIAISGCVLMMAVVMSLPLWSDHCDKTWVSRTISTLFTIGAVMMLGGLLFLVWSAGPVVCKCGC
jgi:hypothetical protein